MFKPSLNTSGAIVVRTEHRFADTSARDTYFASHADELVNLLYIWIEDTSTLQQYYTSTASFISVHPVVGVKGDDGADGTDGHSITVSVQASEPATKAVGDIWVDTDDSLFNTADDSVLWNGIARPTLAGNANKALVVNSAGNAFEFATVAIDGTYASKTDSDLTLYVYEDATGDADGSSKANGFTTLQAAIDAIPDVAQNVTIIVCKGSTNYLGQTTTIQKASVKSLTIQGEFYAYEACDANAVAGKVVDADADFSNFAVGDRVVCTHYSGTVGSSSIDDYFYATITEVGDGYVQTSEGTKVPTTGWRYLINQTVFDGNNGWNNDIHILTPDLLTQTLGLSIINVNARAIAGGRPYVYSSIIYNVQGVSSNPGEGLIYDSAIFSSYVACAITYGAGCFSALRSIFVQMSTTIDGVRSASHGSISCAYCGFFGLYKGAHGATSRSNIDISYSYIDSTCTYGAYGYNITLKGCTNNAATPVYTLTSGGSIEKWNGQALPSIDDATGGQVLALKSDKSGLEFASKQPLDATLTALAGVTTAANKIPYFTGEDTAAVMDIPERSNLIINGDFSVAQRGTSYTSETWRTNADDSYLLDRWLLLSDGNDIVDVTQISGAFSRSRYALQAEVETANKRFGFCQIIEANACIPLRGQKISVSFAAKTVTDKVIGNVRVAVLEWTGTADTVTSDVVSNWASNLTFATNWAALNTPANLALTTSEQTFKVENLTVGASCNNLAVFVWVDDTDCAVDDILQLGEVQLVRGSVVPEFVARDDITNCQMYFIRYYASSLTTFPTYFITGGTSDVWLGVNLPTQMRINPSCSILGTRGTHYKLWDTTNSSVNTTGNLGFITRTIPISMIHIYGSSGTFNAGHTYAIELLPGGAIVIEAEL